MDSFSSPLTFLQFFSSQSRIVSKPAVDSIDWKNSMFGPPSFLGPSETMVSGGRRAKR